MERVIKVRQSYGQLDVDLNDYDGFVAHYDQSRIGETVYLKPIGYSRIEKFLITDCCSYSDGSCGWMERNNILVEVDAETIDRWEKELDKNLYLRLVKIYYSGGELCLHQEVAKHKMSLYQDVCQW